MHVESTNAKTIYVSSHLGNDNFLGSSPVVMDNKGPLASIQKAIDLAKEGDVIEVLGGEYYGKIRFFKKKNITLKTYQNQKVFLNGNHKDFGQGWQLLKTIKGSDNRPLYLYEHSIPKDYLNLYSKINPYELAYHYVHKPDGSIFWNYPTLELLEKHPHRIDNGEGMTMTRKKVYLALNQKTNDLSSFKLSLPMALITSSLSSDIMIDGGTSGFILRHGGEHGIVVKDHKPLDGWIKFNNITVINYRTGIQVYSKSLGVEISNCKFIEKSNKEWSWEDKKLGYYKRRGAATQSLPTPHQTSAVAYTGNTNKLFKITNTVIRNTFNGLVVIGDNAVVENNQILNTFDDGLEIEGNCRNIEINNNIFKDCFKSISLCPVKEGPVYIYDNLFKVSKNAPNLYYYDFEKKSYINRISLIFKVWSMPKKTNKGISVEKSKNCHFYNNTFHAYNYVFLGLGGGTKREYDVENFSFFNNIFYSNNYIANNQAEVITGIQLQNNIFYTSKDILNENETTFRFIKSNQQWSNNKFINPGFKKNSIKENNYKLKCFSKAYRKFGLGIISKKIPLEWPNSAEINKRNYIGATQN